MLPMAEIWQRARLAGLLALLGIAALAPLVATDFQLFRLTNILIFAIALLGVNILVGCNGQISLGHGAFYGVGAYFMIEVPDLDAAISWATRCPGAIHGTAEVRPIWPM
jgi:branched-chain amino acid transport system permease protein